MAFSKSYQLPSILLNQNFTFFNLRTLTLNNLTILFILNSVKSYKNNDLDRSFTKRFKFIASRYCFSIMYLMLLWQPVTTLWDVKQSSPTAAVVKWCKASLKFMLSRFSCLLRICDKIRPQRPPKFRKLQSNENFEGNFLKSWQQSFQTLNFVNQVPFFLKRDWD